MYRCRQSLLKQKASNQYFAKNLNTSIHTKHLLYAMENEFGVAPLPRELHPVCFQPREFIVESTKPGTLAAFFPAPAPAPPPPGRPV